MERTFSFLLPVPGLPAAGAWGEPVSFFDYLQENAEKCL